MNAASLVSIVIAALGWALLQFVWQAGVVGLVYAAARWLLPRGNPRYLAALLALAVLVIWPAVTVWRELAAGLSAVDLPAVAALGSAGAAGAPAPALPGWHRALAAAVPWLVLVWALGVAVLGTRVFRQWRGLRALLRAAEALPAWQARARRFADALGLRRMVPVLASVRVVTPTLVGWVRPAVVLPLALLARMPAAQIDLILAHELAHLKRLDHLANLFQVVVETLFFYHPAVHWISRDARNERELCCDALALRVTRGRRRDFVAALANLEAFRAGDTALALAASGGVLAERAWFIAGALPAPRRHSRGNLLIAVAAVALVGLAWTTWQRASQRAGTLALVAASDRTLLQATEQRTARMPLQWADAAAGAPSLSPVPPAVLAPATPTPVPPRSLRLLDPPSLRLPVAPLRSAPVMAIPPSARVLAPAAATATAPPRAVHTVRPVYPAAELWAGTQARVVVEFALDARGVPRHLEVLGAGAGPFAVAALQALQQWRFAAPTAGGRRYRQAFSFVLGADAAASPAAAQPCVVTTGTHICRPVTAAGAGVTAFKRLR
ncbi:MAG: TonB family protein [Rhodanobacteraceae bacterium]|nr:MAG: TonB family protein [Rhodanobacteraceae bacterium]